MKKVRKVPTFGITNALGESVKFELDTKSNVLVITSDENDTDSNLFIEAKHAEWLGKKLLKAAAYLKANEQD